MVITNNQWDSYAKDTRFSVSLSSSQGVFSPDNYLNYTGSWWQNITTLPLPKQLAINFGTSHWWSGNNDPKGVLIDYGQIPHPFDVGATSICSSWKHEDKLPNYHLKFRCNIAL